MYYDLRNSNNNCHEKQISAGNVASLEVAWSSPVTERIDGRTGPLVVGDTVYVGNPSRVFAIDVATGTLRWSFPVGHTFVTGLARAGNLVYVTDVLPHAIYALDAATGKEVWHIDARSGTTGPTVIGSLLLYNDIGTLHAVDARTGESVWTAPVDPGSYPAVWNGTVYVGGLNGIFYAVDLTGGTILWELALDHGSIEASMSIHAGIAYFGNDHGYFFAVDTASHQLLWRRHLGDTGSQIFATPAIAGGLVLINVNQGALFALHAKNGNLAWHIDNGNAPSVANGIVYTVLMDTFVQAYDRRTAALLWSFDPPGGGPDRVTVGGGTVYFANNADVFAMRLPPAP